MTAEPIFASVNNRGTITLPASIRRRLHLDEPGTQVAISVNQDNVIEMRPYRAIPADQAWYWTPEWQAGEREASEQIARGEGEVYLNGVDFLASFEEPASPTVDQ